MKSKYLLWLPLAAFSLSAFAEGDDQLWQVTVQMNDRISGASMTSQPQLQCLRRQAGDEEIMPLQEGCRMIDQRADGTRTHFRFQCAGNQLVTGEGEIDRPTPDTYRGQMHMQSTAGQGRTIDLVLTYSGQRVGSCTADQPLPANGQ